MKKGYTEIACVIDRSGSMFGLAGDARGGFNQFIEDQIGQGGEARITVVLFNETYNIPWQGERLSRDIRLTEHNYQPMGSTAMLDAIGRTIDDLGERLKNLTEEERPETVIVAILTDGLENASRNFSYDQISRMIEHQQSVYDWKFLFLAANQDAVVAGGRINIPRQHTQTFEHSGIGTRSAYSDMSDTVSALRVGEDVDLQSKP